MPITPTNRAKHTITPSGRNKTFNSVYGIAVYGISTYGTGVAGLGFFTNRQKTLGSDGTWASQSGSWATMLFTWAEYAGIAWRNRTKN